MLLLLAGYGLAAVAFYSYIYLTAGDDPKQTASTQPAVSGASPDSSKPICATHSAIRSSHSLDG